MVVVDVVVLGVVVAGLEAVVVGLVAVLTAFGVVATGFVVVVAGLAVEVAGLGAGFTTGLVVEGCVGCLTVAAFSCAARMERLSRAS